MESTFHWMRPHYRELCNNLHTEKNNSDLQFLTAQTWGKLQIKEFTIYELTLKVEIVLPKGTKFILPVNTCLRAVDLPTGSNIIDIFLLGDVLIYHIHLVEIRHIICMSGPWQTPVIYKVSAFCQPCTCSVLMVMCSFLCDPEYHSLLPKAGRIMEFQQGHFLSKQCVCGVVRVYVCMNVCFVVCVVGM